MPSKRNLDELVVDDLRIKLTERLVIIGDRRCSTLARKEFELLSFLARESPRPFSRAALYERVWGAPPPSKGSLKTVETHVRGIRRKLNLVGGHLLVTLRGGLGYAVRPMEGFSDDLGEKKKAIFDFLNGRIFRQVLAPHSKASVQAKNGIKRTIRHLRQHNAEGMRHYFWDSIVGNERSTPFSIMMKKEGFTRFEDLIDEFRARFSTEWLRS
jgi:DNA-binding winged helix-turn-helix (wHTH) protein